MGIPVDSDPLETQASVELALGRLDLEPGDTTNSTSSPTMSQTSSLLGSGGDHYDSYYENISDDNDYSDEPDSEDREDYDDNMDRIDDFDWDDDAYDDDQSTLGDESMTDSAMLYAYDDDRSTLGDESSSRRHTCFPHWLTSTMEYIGRKIRSAYHYVQSAWEKLCWYIDLVVYMFTGYTGKPRGRLTLSVGTYDKKYLHFQPPTIT